MAIKIYNTLTKNKEEFKPLDPGQVSMYTCGVTVYDHCHIGHARSLYIFDVIKRYLKYRDYEVKFVRNITDIDDKIINKAKAESLSSVEVAKQFIASYEQDLKLLGIDKAWHEPRATENIKAMIEHISGLIDKGCAYESEGDVYFDVRKFKDYGKLSGQSLDKMMAGVRKEVGEKKRDPLDFALWKKSKEEEPSWDSPWGKGRPGWHIECSVMSLKHLKTQTLDIHAGGRDLIFPHHENEIAQAQALTGKTFANYWIHHGLLTINEQKMAKSLGNFITIKDFIKQHDVDILKLFFLSAHYSSSIDYNEKKIQECRKQKLSFSDFFDKVNTWELYEGKVKTVSSEKDKRKIDEACLKFEQAMDDDFNTPVALAALFELLDLGSGFISCDKEEAFNVVSEKLENFFHILGLSITPKPEIPKGIELKRKQRDKAKASKDFDTADVIREELKHEGYNVMDTRSASAIIPTRE